MKSGSHLFRIIICLVLCCSLIFSCLHVKTEAVALEATLGIGVAAILLLLAAGVIFRPQTHEEIKAIGQNFQTHMYKWGEENNKTDIVDVWIQGIQVDLTGGSGGRDPRILVDNAISAGISLWIINIIEDLIKVENTFDEPSFGFTVTGAEKSSSSYIPEDSLEFLAQSYPEQIWDCFPLLGVNKYVMITCISSTSPYNIYGYYFDENGIFTIGYFTNPLGNVHASLFGIYELSEFTLIDSKPLTTSVYNKSYDSPIFYSKAYAEQYPDFLTSDVLAFNFDASKPVYKQYAYAPSLYGVVYNFYSKEAEASGWSSSGESRVLVSDLYTKGYYPQISTVSWNIQYPVIEPDTMVGDIVDGVQSGDLDTEDIPVTGIDYSMIFPDNVDLLEGIQNVGDMMSSGDLTLDEYHNITDVGSSTAAKPIFVSDIPLGSSITYKQGVAASPITVIASSSDGGTVSYEWYRYGTDASGKVYPVEVLGTTNSFAPPTTDVGTAYYHCRVINTNADGLVAYNYSTAIEIVVEPSAGTDPNPGTDPDTGVDDEEKIVAGVTGAWNNSIKQSLQDLLDNVFKQNTSNQQEDDEKQGGVYADQIIGMVPDYSADFLPPLRNLADSLGYTGTSCVLTMPAITVPAVGNLFSETTFLEETSINFEDYFSKMPSTLLTIVRTVFDITIVLFCLREAMGLFQGAFTGFKKPKEDSNE